MAPKTQNGGGTAGTRKPGRPRDPELESRALEAARSVYAKRGWAGFTLDEVARKSGMGKGSLYLRWTNKPSLLIAAVRSRIPQFYEIDHGNIEDDLLDFTRRWMGYMRGIDGALTNRLSIDQRFYPELREAAATDRHPQYLQATVALVRQAVERGEIPADTRPALIGDVLAGAVSNHVRVTPQSLLDDEGHVDEYVRELVSFALRGILGVSAARHIN